MPILSSACRALAGFRRWAGNHCGTAGFTLIEVLVGVTILAIALSAILQIFSTGFRSTLALETQAIATLQARSKLAEVGPIIPLEESEVSGVFENEWAWQVVITQIVLPELVDPDVELLDSYEIEVTVTDDRGRRTRLQSVALAPRQR